MKASRKMLMALAGLIISAGLTVETGLTALAGGPDYLDMLNGGVSAVLDPGATGIPDEAGNAEAGSRSAEAEEEDMYNRVMANVQNALNIRSEASEDSRIVGKLYKDCGGTILEQKEGWTCIQSGNVIGWASNQYLLFGEEAAQLASDVGKMIAQMKNVVRVRMAPDREAEVLGVLPRGEIVEALSGEEDGWVCVDYNGEEGYVLADYLTLDFLIDVGETVEEIKAREAAELAAKREAERHKNYGQYTTDADTTLLLAALIQCEAGSEIYEGKLAVASVVMNRVRSGAYPNSIHGVIYASGQFTPALSGKVNQVYEARSMNDECIRAAEEAISGVSNVGDYTHFRRNNGRDGIVIGHHVFY